jgi:hypothetical protein
MHKLSYPRENLFVQNDEAPGRQGRRTHKKAQVRGRTYAEKGRKGSAEAPRRSALLQTVPSSYFNLLVRGNRSLTYIYIIAYLSAFVKGFFKFF